MSERAIDLDQSETRLLQVLRSLETPVDACYQCLRCTAGCPMLPFMDIPPNRVIRMLQYGLEEQVLASHTLWLCASCQTCTTRCPNDVDIAHVMDLLRRESMARGYACPESDVAKFHNAFLKEIQRGRVHELSLIGRFKLSTRRFTEDMKLGIEMFKRGRIKLIPSRIRRPESVRKLFQKANKGA